MRSLATFSFSTLLSLFALARAEAQSSLYELTEEEKRLLGVVENDTPALPDVDERLLEDALQVPVTLTAFELVGSTVLSDDEVRRVVSPWIGRPVTGLELSEIRSELTALYAGKGYIGSGVILPDQTVTGGLIKMHAVELTLSGIDVSAEGLSEDYLRRRLERTVSSPLNLTELERSLRSLQEQPLVSSVQARLVDGATPGTSRLLMSVDRAQPFTAQLSVNNFRPPSIGAEQAVVSLVHRDISGRRDILAFEGAIGEESKSGWISYDMPFGTTDSRIRLSYRQGDTVVIEEPFDDIDIESVSSRVQLGIAHPFYQTWSRQLDGFASLIVSKTETSLLERPFSFSLGAIDGETRTSVVEIGGQFTQRWTNQVFSSRLTWREGLDAFDATTRLRDTDLTSQAEVPDGMFSAAVIQMSYGRNLPFLNSQLSAQLTYQHAFDPLLVSEKSAVGGVGSVRGYRENSLVRDSAGFARIEWRIPVLSTESPMLLRSLTLVPFADTGWAKDKDPNQSSGSSVSISSVGLGLEWSPLQFLYFRGYFGEALDSDSVPSTGSRSLQDDGVHVEISVNWPPG